jgi:hypothetical protein
MKKLLIASATLLASAAAIAQVAPANSPAVAPAAKVHTRAEVQAMIAQHFAKLDTNRDGALTKAEAEAARQSMHSQRGKLRADRREGTFDRMDSNRDGAISRGERDAASAQREQRMMARDGNGDGRRNGRNWGRGGMASLGGHMFEMADGNRDGRVTLQEAQAAALRHFDMADVNRDGQITPEERKQMRQRMRAEDRG